MSGARIRNNYGEMDGLTADAQAIIGRIREEIIPDCRSRYLEAIGGTDGVMAEAFSDITQDYMRRLDNLEAAMSRLNGTVARIAGSGGDVQLLDQRLSGLFAR